MRRKGRYYIYNDDFASYKNTNVIIDSFSKMLNPLGYICIADLDEEDGSFHGDGFNGHNDLTDIN